MNVDFDTLWQLLTERFRLGDFSLHGPDHWKRVEENGVALARRNGADLTVVRLFAVFHDSERENESVDPQHGERAAALVEAWHGAHFSIGEEQIETLVLACRDHHHGYTSNEITIGTCWDADRLDLPRVGMVPDPEYMSTEDGKQWAATGGLRTS